MYKFRFILLFYTLTFYASVQSKASPTFPLGKKETIVFRKNYPFLYYCFHTPAVRTVLLQDSLFSMLAHQQRKHLQRTLNSTPTNTDTFAIINSLELMNSTITAVAARLGQWQSLHPQLFLSLQQWTQKSGYYPAPEGSNSIIQTAWLQDAKAINYTIAVYGKGSKPNYPHIDSISFNTSDRSYPMLQRMLGQQVYKETDSLSVFFYQPLLTALRLLELNDRYNIADYEPMELTVNAAAVASIKTIQWKNYPYTHINILGAGNDNKEDTLNPIGMLRCRLGALQYFMKRAPFIIVSGGRVHPYKTSYCEAEEMKQYLMNELGIPENAIFVEPHARHTTTNLRNTARLLIRYGVPLDKPGIICTTFDQIGMVLNPKFATRCQKELGYLPYNTGKQLSETEIEYYPLPVSMRINPTEPLDP